MELKQSLVDELTENPGQKASQLATKLNADRHEINRLLHNQLRHQFEQDTTYKWWPINQTPHQKSEGPALGFSDTPLARLCRYYLACLGQDDLAEVSTWARSQYDYDYVALDTVPLDGINNLLQEPGPASLLASMQRDRSAKVLYLGYPICIHRFTSKRGEPIYRLEPVLYLPVQFEHPDNRGPASVLSDYPMINTAVLQRFSNADRNTLMDELVQLEKELGFANADAEVPELDEVAQRLFVIRREWPWHEACDGSDLPDIPPIHNLNEAGIYNRAVLVSAERKPYTQGLENELRELGKLNESEFAHSILGKLINNSIPKSELVTNETMSLLEVLPMNTEQRQAIQYSLTKPLTIITGPPGTGKSQVVTNLLVNAAWQNRKVLFASKNNKAVDVVETRVNSLGPRPILLRTGSNEYQQKLSDYVQELLSATAGPDEMQDYEAVLTEHKKLVEKMAEISAALDRVIHLRNEVDSLEQSVEYLRPTLGTELFQFIRKNLDKDWRCNFESFFNALLRAEKTKQSLFDRLIWLSIKKSRILQLVNEFKLLNESLTNIGLSLPTEMTGETGLQQYLGFAEQIEDRLAEIGKVSKYFQLLHELQTGDSLESLNQRHREMLSEIADNSNRLWASWLKVHAAKLNKENRQLLSQYAAAIKMVIDSRDGRTSKSVWQKYYSLNKKVSQLLPCWAVTSLSARGKLPFTAGYYDLVVFDEASQCDIASALPLLYRAKHAVIIGDRQQLSHISRIQKRQDQKLLERFDLVNDYLQWAYVTNSLFEMAQSYAESEDIVDLKDHHRSHADIINFSNKFFYEGRLRIATRYDQLKLLGSNKLKEPGVRWIDVKGQTTRPDAGSAVNQKEAEAVLLELKRLLLEQGYKGSIGVVSPFRAQANVIKELCSQYDELQRPLDDAEFLSDTVHRFQGDERDLMIFSPVISEGTVRQSLNFLKNNHNLFNVAITRARAMLLVVGDQTATRNCGVNYLEKFARYVDQLSEVSLAAMATAQTNEFGPMYPESIDRSKVSDWEVILYEALYGTGIKTIPQYSIEQYLLDLAVVDGDRRLDVEVDGERYHRNWTGELCRRDQIRNQRLYELGWDVLRFWVYEVRDELDDCVGKVKLWLERSQNI
ncbi:MAG: AAA domain-containing protein [Gammaproteobacteria bacterium]|nr:AAA domain-containing protein [Gammaproteobacteria bacterium]